jgi:hypothetical protein
MNVEKERHLKALDQWNAKAAAEQIACAVCGAQIKYDDRDVFYEKGMCGACDKALEIDA